MRRELAVAIAVGVVAVASLSSCSSSGGPIARSDRVPGGLVDVGWILVSVQPEGQTTVPVAEHVLVLRSSGGATFDVSRCTQWRGLMQFHGEDVDVGGRVSPHSCPPAPDVYGGPDLLEPIEVAVMQGSLRWSLDADRLLLTKDGVGVLSFSRGASDPPSPSS